jgi:hypothetical protein
MRPSTVAGLSNPGIPDNVTLVINPCRGAVVSAWQGSEIRPIPVSIQNGANSADIESCL